MGHATRALLNARVLYAMDYALRITVQKQGTQMCGKFQIDMGSKMEGVLVRGRLMWLFECYSVRVWARISTVIARPVGQVGSVV